MSQAVQSADLTKWLQDRELLQQLVRQHLIRAQSKMKVQADKHHTDRVFNVGDSVYLKAQPYVQTSLAPRSSNKLAFRFFRPFIITDRVGPSAYRLKLPSECLIHPVLHVSMLKRDVLANNQVHELPNFEHELHVPEAILDQRLKRDRVKGPCLVLVIE